MNTTAFLKEHLVPFVNKLVDLGTSLERWRKIWTVDLDISGVGTISRAPTTGTDIVNKTYADALPASVTVEEVDGAPSLAGITTIRFDQADGFVVSQPGAGIARIDLTTSAGISQVEDIDSVPQYTGLTNLQFDQADGFVITNPVAGTVRIDLAAIPDAAITAISASKITGSFDNLGAALTGQLGVGDGGTGATTLTDHGVLIGRGTAAVEAMANLTKGQLLVGQTGANPTALAISTDGYALVLDSSQAAGVKWAVASAGVQPDFYMSPTNAAFPASNFPELKKGAGTNHIQYTLGFDTTTGESAYWTFMIPSTAVFTAATIKIASRQLAATTGTLGWTVTTLTRADAEAYDTAGASDTVTASTVKGTVGQLLIQSKALTVTGWAAGEVLQVKLTRDVANDTVAEDGEFVYAVIELS